MFDLLDYFFNLLRSIKFFLLTVFGLLISTEKVIVPSKKYKLNLSKSIKNFDSSFTLGQLPGEKYQNSYLNDYWSKPPWTPLYPRYFWRLPWGDSLPTRLENFVERNVRCEEESLRLYLSLEGGQYKGGLLYSNFTVTGGNLIEIEARLPKVSGVASSFWVKSVGFEVSGGESFGEWKHKSAISLYHGLLFTLKGGSYIRRGSIRGFSFSPTTKFYKYWIEIDPIKNTTNIYINGILVRSYHRTSTSNMNLILDVGVYKDSKQLPSVRHLPDYLEIKSISIYDHKLFNRLYY